MATSQQRCIDVLNGFLRAEMSAVETYEQAIAQLPEDELSLKKVLGNCRESHEQRVQWLEAEVDGLGGKPATHLSSTGALAKLVERGAAVFGKKAAMKALEEGEAFGLNSYEHDSSDLTPALQQFVEDRLLPEQRHTHATLTQVTSRL